MFSADDIDTRHYELQLDKCWQIYRKASRKAIGLSHTVRGLSISDHARKIQILGVSEVRGEKILNMWLIK